MNEEIVRLKVRVGELEKVVVEQKDLNERFSKNIQQLIGVVEEQNASIKLLAQSQELLAEKLLGVKL